MWSEHNIKRALSLYEKYRLKDHSMLKDSPIPPTNALIMPGEPNTEVEELIQFGYNPQHIYGVEYNKVLFDELHEHYFDSINLHHCTMQDYLRSTKNKFSYIHVDLCGHVSPGMYDALLNLSNIIDTYARIRISALSQRRSQLEMAFENGVTDHILLPLIEKLRERAPAHTKTWDQAEDYFTTNFADPLVIPAAAIIANLFFGHTSGEFIPILTNKFSLMRGAPRKLKYQSGPNTMYTIWFDIGPVTEASSYGLAGLDTLFPTAFPPAEFNPDNYPIPEDSNVQVSSIAAG